MISPDFDNPPFAADPACPRCNKPWKDHPSVSILCNQREDMLVVLKATAINTQEIHQMLVKVIAFMEEPQTPKKPNPQDSSLQDGQES